MSDEERRAAENLIVMCHRHHKIIDCNPNKYTTEFCRKIKREHEAKFAMGVIGVDGEILESILAEELSYWSNIESISQERTRHLEVAIEIETSKDLIRRIEIIRDNIAWIEDYQELTSGNHRDLDKKISLFLQSIGCDSSKFDQVPYYENPFWQPQWEFDTIGLPNNLTEMRVRLLEMEVILLEEILRTGAAEEKDTERLRASRNELMQTAVEDHFVE